MLAIGGSWVAGHYTSCWHSHYTGAHKWRWGDIVSRARLSSLTSMLWRCYCPRNGVTWGTLVAPQWPVPFFTGCCLSTCPRGLPVSRSSCHAVYLTCVQLRSYVGGPWCIGWWQMTCYSQLWGSQCHGLQHGSDTPVPHVSILLLQCNSWDGTVFPSLYWHCSQGSEDYIIAW